MRAKRTREAGGQRSLSRQTGVTALEYGILAAIVALLVGATVFTNLTTVLTNVFSNLTSVATSAVNH
ncbi:Flp family type IVb pilin [Pandoraea sp. XY-2]|uniref:Flp family type IVb pilin n=1 Tax=Pandoraea sp. XY-2 TaxID=2518599 RepID=UPI00101B0712|nr:Flp family type IVb pilin [Pandoraea sp. XY-2]QBC33912.1 Flp family type IVb pilin [Pandoraea sp. XY-2]